VSSIAHLSSMPELLCSAVRVVDVEGFAIDEFAGNVSTNSDQFSLAHCTVKHPTGEPWLTIQYDEWMCVLSGRVLLHHEGANSPLEAQAGQTVFIKKGERIRPEFPEVGSYVPLCIPAFRPDRCFREDDTDARRDAGETLREMHTNLTSPSRRKEVPEVLYHLCERTRWE